ncbi:RNA polymerase sigma-70 factor [Chitinophaga oryzae]|uniref:RNA polymerase sigma-70 factor n=1 Tax=Chitinophaga oryzae TaxID=2725414 RepID=A0AAE6ZKT8_9BACT|nr:RNA polymerase sigma-70 factor [Chitinophaga oryzae]QJB34871.1 RNA polymerase sigma-70 factor [Chitinophaga oryzae]QJB41383.1 RNA polymerase sigma-70 factor [Chitinophaga oryzae]
MSDYNTYTDDHLWRQITLDDQDAFTAVYHRYWKVLYLRARNMLSDSDLAQDIVQEVFISLWHRRQEVEILHLKAYLFQAVRFQELKALRNLKSDTNFYERLAHISKDLLQHEPMAFKELDSVLQRVMATIPEDQRAIFSMSRDEGLTYREIADRMEISVKTVEKKISQALRTIRKGMDSAFPLLLSVMAVMEKNSQ